MRILVSGFEPFGASAVNPTQELIRSLNKSTLLADAVRAAGITLQAAILPVTFADAFLKLKKEIWLFKPDFVLAFGVAPGRSHAIEIERIGINILDANIKDNAGAQPVDEPIEEAGPAARFATLPIKQLVSDLNKAGVPARVSNTAGTYVCNYLLYKLMGADLGHAKAGFIHVPSLPDATNVLPNSMSLETLEKALAVMFYSVTGTPVPDPIV